MLKKLSKIFRFKSKIIITKIFNYLLIKLDNTSLPNLDKKYISDLSWDNNTNTMLFKKNNEKVKILRVDVTNFKSELCKIGASLGTDKSPYNTKGARHSYTAIYDIFFSHLKDEQMNLAEIGIAKNSSIKMFRKYFSKAKIIGFENNAVFLNNAIKDNLKNTKYYHIDVSNEKNILNAFNKTKKKFRIIIDDSTHLFKHQINVIKNTFKFLESGGFLIIEDLAYFDNLEIEYINKLNRYMKFFNKVYFIEANHINKFTMHKESVTNDRLLILIKK